jgi:hypothetical protein
MWQDRSRCSRSWPAVGGQNFCCDNRVLVTLAMHGRDTLVLSSQVLNVSLTFCFLILDFSSLIVCVAPTKCLRLGDL